MSIINIIKAAPLFYELYDNEIDAIIEKCSVMSLESGELIIKDGDVGEDFFIILTGTAAVKKGDVLLAELRKETFLVKWYYLIKIREVQILLQQHTLIF